MIKGNILTEIHDDYVSKQDNLACLTDYEI